MNSWSHSSVGNQDQLILFTTETTRNMAYGPFLHLWLLVFFSTDKDTSLSVTFLSSHISFFRLYMWVSSTSSVIVFFPFLLLSRISRLRDVFFDRLMGCRFVQPQSVMRAFDPTFHAVYGTFRPVSFVCRAVDCRFVLPQPAMSAAIHPLGNQTKQIWILRVDWGVNMAG